MLLEGLLFFVLLSGCTVLWLDSAIETEMLRGWMGDEGVSFYRVGRKHIVRVVEGGEHHVRSVRIGLDLRRMRGELMWQQALRDLGRGIGGGAV